VERKKLKGENKMDSKQKRQEASRKERLQSAFGKKTNPMRKERFNEGQKARRKAGLKKGFKKVASALTPGGAAVATAKKIFGKKKKKPNFQKGDYSKISVK
jgi:hypothetical protein